jgi:hypothetical protein
MSGTAPNGNDRNKGRGRGKGQSKQNQAQGIATNVVRTRPETPSSYDAAFPTLQAATSNQTTTAANVPPSNMVGICIRNSSPYLLLLIFARRSQ